MPFDLRIIRVQEFLKIDPTGIIDFLHAAKYLKEIAALHGDTHINILLDLRHTSKPFALNDQQTWTLVENVMREFPETFTNKLALLDKKTSSIDQEEFFVHCARAKGFPTRLFSSLDAAIEWLGEPQEPPSEAPPP